MAYCWYRYYVERKTSDDKWTHEDSGDSNEHFLLVDDTGQCVISPEGAEVLSKRKQTWEQNNYRYTEWLLLPKGILYAIGEFSTTSLAAASRSGAVYTSSCSSGRAARHY